MSSVRSKVSRAYAFTLVELLVVIGIIALLISILLPSLNAARMSAGNVKCLSNLRQIGQLLTIYTDSNKGLLPYAKMDYRPPNYYSSEVTSWSITLGALLNRGSNTVFNASQAGRKVFTDDPQALEVTSDFGTVYLANSV